MFTLGDKPELKWDFALTQLKELGHSSTHDYLISSMKVVNEKFNLFPHANPGLMSKQEIKELKKHSPSGGVMIESFSKNKQLMIRSPNATRPWQHVLDPLCGYLNLTKKLYHNKSIGLAANFVKVRRNNRLRNY